MGFKPPFEIGEEVTNAVMTEAFKVGNMGGMRRSKTTGTLVLISDNTKGLYNDKWHEGVLLYTGMGKVGDQTLTGNQNKTLAESDTNGVEVHLFEVDDPGKYKYSGVVKLAGKPYQETQPDENGNPRKVWMFPLKKVSEVKVVPETATESLKTTAEKEPEEEKHFVEGAVEEQSVVQHNRFGTGTVRKIEDGKIYVEFAGGQRIFQYPDCFEKGYLTL